MKYSITYVIFLYKHSSPVSVFRIETHYSSSSHVSCINAVVSVLIFHSAKITLILYKIGHALYPALMLSTILPIHFEYQQKCQRVFDIKGLPPSNQCLQVVSTSCLLIRGTQCSSTNVDSNLSSCLASNVATIFLLQIDLVFEWLRSSISKPTGCRFKVHIVSPNL